MRAAPSPQTTAKVSAPASVCRAQRRCTLTFPAPCALGLAFDTYCDCSGKLKISYLYIWPFIGPENQGLLIRVA